MAISGNLTGPTGLIGAQGGKYIVRKNSQTYTQTFNITILWTWCFNWVNFGLRNQPLDPLSSIVSTFNLVYHDTAIKNAKLGNCFAPCVYGVNYFLKGLSNFQEITL